jgi:hypothetical protein
MLLTAARAGACHRVFFMVKTHGESRNDNFVHISRRLRLEAAKREWSFELSTQFYHEVLGPYGAFDALLKKALSLLYGKCLLCVGELFRGGRRGEDRSNRPLTVRFL